MTVEIGRFRVEFYPRAYLHACYGRKEIYWNWHRGEFIAER